MVAFMRRRTAAALLSITGLLVLALSNPAGEWWTALQQPYQSEDLIKCACDKCIPEGDDWFMAHLNQTIHPFLTPQSNLSAKDFLWWKKLQGDPNDLAAFKRVVDKVFKLFPDGKGFMDSGSQRCRSCSVVGNSGNLLASHNGALIDFSDFVFRMNGAPTKGYEEHVGKKTTFHIMYPESAVDLTDNRTHLMLVPFKTLDLQWLISAFTTGSIKFTYLPVKAKINANKDLVRILNPQFIKYVYEVWLRNSGGYPSTGFLGLMLAIHICEEVNVFGFGADQNGNWRHYWEELKDKRLRTGLHSGTEEYRLIQKLAAKGKFYFFPGH
ncbi:CMP-N-acetylneuraminate-beta-galactosamide-alpha-2,3-sialyltransferase 1-like isoform X1 [Gadus macrocephalus]|uniref:CMP-N-acetylneuraminate-beta-galactosamide- alpha-2,3-sialyltransferase 1-like isoform X1 n=2 Tax=Gadus macrocephalus TaxID=80720 RepID=UPI0028CB9992|nr:CMP-N-acetylneuraminate-beta-galactosamide-alpha-2,3-sialyltransferase 1-like isoform X1 [Gadus macrocephalus]XP_059899365.1 CMP-N-acetylneuraminate-beta-galactosamide-alpha-2,3-sialyltransferase 1-like isoform X1 [Gadus macrocephalus]